jgi:PKD repeat protein
VRGETLPFTASFSDVGSLDTHQVQWDFGDGTVIPFTPTTTSGALSPSHIYTQNGTYTLTVTVRDDDGGLSAKTATIQIRAIALQQDRCDPLLSALVVGGTTSADTIVFSPSGNGGAIKVTMNGVSLGVFSPTGQIIAFGQAGDDDIQVAGGISLPAWLYGDNGDDRLKGGDGHDILQGGEGADLLIGGGGRDLLIGGSGADRIVGNAEDDILIAGNINFADQTAALCAIMDEWTSARSFAQRVDNLVHGTSSNRANGNVLLQNGTTVVDDSDVDRLTGSSGSDWFFFSDSQDTATDLHSDEVFEDLEWL